MRSYKVYWEIDGIDCSEPVDAENELAAAKKFAENYEIIDEVKKCVVIPWCFTSGTSDGDVSCFQVVRKYGKIKILFSGSA